MIAVTWILFVLLALLWTGAAWIAAAVLRWATEALASGAASHVAVDMAGLDMPEWMEVWIDPYWLMALQAAVQSAIDGAGAMLPLANLAAAWLVPAVWITWGLGMILLVIAAIGAHVLLRRLARRRASPPPAPGAA